MPVIQTKPITAVLIDSIIGDDAPPGGIKFYKTADHNPAGFHFQCPCGCGSIGGVEVAGPGAWKWNGSRVAPTIRPSVLLHGGDGPHWHGWLTDGVWASC